MSKPKFNPNKPFQVAQESKPAFDPNAAFEVVEEKPKTTATQAFSGSMADSALLGNAPQVRAGIIDPIVEAVGNLVTGQDVDMGDYVTNRDSYRREIETAAKEHPVASGAGTLTGAVATSVVPGLNVAKGATAGARVLNAARAGTIAGALANPGDVEGDISGAQIPERLENAGIGMATGAIFQGAGEGVAKGVSKAKSAAQGYFKDLAEEKAVKATGAMKRDFNALAEKGKVKQIGRQLLDEKIVTPLARPKVIAERLRIKVGKSIADLQNQLSKADETLLRPEGFNMENATTQQIEAFKRGQITSKQIRDKMVSDIVDAFPGVPEEELAPAINKIDIWMKDRPEVMSVKELQQMKTGLNDFLKKSDFYKDMPGMNKEGLLSVRKGAKEAIENKANSAADILGEAGGGIKETNRKLGNFIEAQDLADDAIARDAANRSISLTDTIAGAGGGSIAGIPGALASAAANKAGRMYGNSLMATGFDRLSKTLSSPSTLARVAQNTSSPMAMILNNLRNNPETQNSPQMNNPDVRPLGVLGSVAQNEPKLEGFNERETVQLSSPQEAQFVEGEIKNNSKLTPTQKAQRLNLLRKHGRVYAGQ